MTVITSCSFDCRHGRKL